MRVQRVPRHVRGVVVELVFENPEHIADNGQPVPLGDKPLPRTSVLFVGLGDLLRGLLRERFSQELGLVAGERLDARGSRERHLLRGAVDHRACRRPWCRLAPLDLEPPHEDHELGDGHLPRQVFVHDPPERPDVPIGQALRRDAEAWQRAADHLQYLVKADVAGALLVHEVEDLVPVAGGSVPPVRCRAQCLYRRQQRRLIR
mmetsp:Transcript_73814/g.190500  ORF Transcript_73814/g.190500 Transcript_73814/m.190500 type:complete len:203 (+) Transcript_73814:192-800(+)